MLLFLDIGPSLAGDLNVIILIRTKGDNLDNIKQNRPDHKCRLEVISVFSCKSRWHVVGEDGLQVDPAKVEGVHCIMAHTKVGRGGTTTSGLCNYYYRSVIQGFGRDCQTLTPPTGVQFTFQSES